MCRTMMPMIQTEKTRGSVIYDLGMHRGEDTEFYLKKGFVVVAVEANPVLCDQNAERFAREIGDGRLTIVNRAVSNIPGVVDFFFNEHVSEWGTTRADWARRNAERGAPSVIGKVATMTLAELFVTFGEPYFLKIDIEGADVDCLAELAKLAARPRYISVEASGTSLHDTLAQLTLLDRLGYRRFRIVPQHTVCDQRPPQPAREGAYVDHVFPRGASGLFGEEAPGPWLSLTRAQWLYRRIHAEMRLIGPNNGLFRGIQGEWAKAALRRAFPWGIGWFDTHAGR